MNRSIFRLLLCVLCVCSVVLMCSCGQKKKPETKLDVWKLVSTNPADEHGTYLGNGFISTRIMGEGIGFSNSKPLDCYMAGLYLNEKLTAIPTWSDVQFYDGNSQFVLDKESAYKQTLDMKNGTLVTEGTWKSSGKSLKGQIYIIVSRDKPGMAIVSTQMQADFEGPISIRHRIGESSGFKLVKTGVENNVPVYTWELSGTSGDRYVSCASGYSFDGSNAYTVAPEKIDAQTTAVNAAVKRGMLFRSAVWVSWSRENSVQTAIAGSTGELKKALLAEKSSQTSEADFIAAHTAAWAKLWEKDIIIAGNPKAQQALHSCMFYLLQSVREGSKWSIAPMGLSNNSFNGHIFWDADTWMFPALILQHPQLARAIVDYRYETLAGARRNAAAAGVKGAQFAWESGETGIEDAPKGIDYVHERHINSDVSLAQWQYYLATLDKNWLKTRGYPVISASADFWVSRAKLVNGRYEIKGVVPPDENAGIVDNSVYTNAGAKLNLLIAVQAARIVGAVPNPNWQKVADGMYIPFDAANNRYIARDKYTDQKLKQADPELLIYPLQIFPKGTDELTVAKNTYDYYVPKVNVNGPAMSSSVHSLIAARLGNKQETIDRLNASYKPFLRGSFNYFNEKRSKTYKNACFLTGAAGPMQAIVFGIAGARMEYLQTKPLEFKPCLPDKWKSVTLKNVQWQGKTFDVVVDSMGYKLETVSMQ